ncbi:hypothetical protein [Labedaea rhizosphaerae]|uniref:hypothetical protein n=1 Tax=Labedaea rhizosphaerae TaxID=598644 RepID=UPI00105DBE23|nr:hypothetical protein [Labedaea rhizosphaerae]
MARFTHAVTLDAVPQAWFGRIVRAAHDQTERLLAGTGVVTAPLRPGTRYAPPDSDVRFTVESWEPRVATSGELTFADETIGLACEFALRSAEAPATFDCAVQLRLPEGDQPAFLRTWSWTGAAELARWWRSAGRVTVTVRNKVGVGEFRLVPVRVDGRQWKVKVTAKLRGQGLARPLVAIALLVLRGRVDRQFVETLRKAERRWHEEIPPLLRRDPDELVQEALSKWRADRA